MNPELSSDPVGRDCDAIQRQISDAADADGSPSAGVKAHLVTCPECADFAAHWLHGPPAALTEAVPVVPSTHELRERILHRNPASNVVRFALPPQMARRPSWSTWVGRIAAGVLLAAFSYWLLDPVVAPPAPARTAAAPAPTLTQGLTRLEDQSKAEREAVRTALVGGGRQVQQSAQWSLSALEL